MIRFILRRFLSWAYKEAYESKTVDATALSPGFILTLGASAPPVEWEPCSLCGVLKRGLHTCPPSRAANVVQIKRKRSTR